MADADAARREQVLARARRAHDRVCSCDPRYLMSCGRMAEAILAQGRPDAEFDVVVSVGLAPDLADRVRAELYAALRDLEGDEPEVLAIEDDLPALWARTLDRQLDPFDVAGRLNEDGEDLRWFGRVGSG